MITREEMSAQAKALIRQSGFKIKRQLGQRFLVDESVLEHILSAAELSYEDVVVEVGPGLGILTKRLAEVASEVIAVELDFRLVSMLREILASCPNVRVVHKDILKIAPQQLLENRLVTCELTEHYKVVANLPYYITSPVIRKFLEASPSPSLMVVMVQREVGEAIAAVPGKMSLLSVRTQFYSKPTIVTHVPAECFYPQPKVASVVLRLEVYSKPPIEVSDVEGFFNIVSHGFSAPRKQLRNSLAHALGIPTNQVVSLLDKVGIEAKRRAETLGLEEWKTLWEVFTLFEK